MCEITVGREDLPRGQLPLMVGCCVKDSDRMERKSSRYSWRGSYVLIMRAYESGGIFEIVLSYYVVHKIQFELHCF